MVACGAGDLGDPHRAGWGLNRNAFTDGVVLYARMRGYLLTNLRVTVKLHSYTGTDIKVN